MFYSYKIQLIIAVYIENELFNKEDKIKDRCKRKYCKRYEEKILRGKI